MKIALMRFRPSRLLAASILLAGCCDTPVTDEPPNDVRIPVYSAPTPSPIRVWAVHDPLYAVSKNDDPTHEAQITARAFVNTGSLAKIDIHVAIGPIVDDCPQFPVYPCMGVADTETKPCPFADNVQDGQCTYPINIAEDQIVSYTATATDSNGNSVTTEAVTFAYGVPSGQTPRPIWWHAEDAPGVERISLALFPDKDYEDYEDDEDYEDPQSHRYAEFATHINDILIDVFFNEDDVFFNEDEEYASTYTANRHFFDLWAAPFGANVDNPACDLDFTFDDLATLTRSWADAAAIIHSSTFHFGDCSNIENPGKGAGSILGQPNENNGWLMAHEAGHFIFSLADEYESGGHVSCSTPASIFKSKQGCEDKATDLGLPTSHCAQIGDLSIWRIDDGSNSLMDAERDWKGSDFRRIAIDAVTNRFAKCQAGQCFEPGNPSCTP